jgi:hypothetical protein
MRESVELLGPSDGARRSRLALNLDPNGNLTLTFHQMGASVQAPWGVDDEEVEVSIRAAEAGRLAFFLLADRLRGQQDGFAALRAYCDRYGIDHDISNWT